MEKVMNKISKKAMDTYQIAAKATSKVAKEFKLKAQMAENKRKIQELYEDIGKTLYEKYVLKEEINIERDLLNNCSMIDILADEVEDIRMELLRLKNLKQCSNCHYEIYYDFHYCPNCGQVQEEQSEKAKYNDGPATIVTTDEEDRNLKKSVPSVRKKEESFEEEPITESDYEEELDLEQDDDE